MMYYPDVPALEPDELELLCHEYLEHNATLDPHLADQMGVKRGLRNLDGTGVLAGITNVSNVIGYDKRPDGTIAPIPGRLVYRGIDIDTLVKLNEALNKFPGLLDNVRVAFGTPDQAGIYTVCAVTNNKNYHTGFAMGSLVVKAHVSDVRLTWNAPINGKLTVEEAAAFDFGATLRYNEKPVADQSSVKCLYTGITSNWQAYSSTTTPPTEPGRYVMTAVTVGGNYQAAPITRSFQITK